MTLRQTILVVGLGIAATAAAALGAPSVLAALKPQEAAAEPRDEALPVQGAPVEARQGFEVERRFAGELRARRRVTLAFDRAERLANLAVDEGQRVSAGELLARLDTSNLEAQEALALAQVAQARAQLAEAEAGPRVETVEAARHGVEAMTNQLAVAELLARHRRELADKGDLAAEEAERLELEVAVQAAQVARSRAELEELENGTRAEVVASARAALQAAEAQLARVRVELEDSALRAPFAALVARVDAELGARVAPGSPVLALVEDAAPEAWVGVPPRVAATLEAGAELDVLVEGRSYAARLKARLPDLDPVTRTRTLVLTLDADGLGSLAPGSLAEVRLTERVPTEAFALPDTALVRSRRGLWAAFALAPIEGSDEYVVERRELELIHTSGDEVLVRGPLSVAERVISAGVHKVNAGQRVRLARNGESAQ
jgi:multidrug efflux pump subunit AcrA (membrane-fusion protein)